MSPVKFPIYSINVSFCSKIFFFILSLHDSNDLAKILINSNLSYLRLGPIAKSNRKGKRRFETEERRRMADHHLHASEANLCNAFIQDKAKVLAMQQLRSWVCTVWSLRFIYCFMATVGDASNYVYRKKRGGSCSLDHQDGGISSKEVVVVTRNRTMALDCIISKRHFRGEYATCVA